MVIIAHRGIHGGPGEENTLRSLRDAARLLDGFECDIRFSSDGVPVVCHDETLTRTHGDQILVSSLHSDDLRARGVPRLEDVMRETRGGSCVMILDLKQRPRQALHMASCMAEHFGIAAGRLVFLVRGDGAYPQPHGTIYRAHDYVFSPRVSASFTGIACKFDGSPANRRCISQALQAGIQLNLYCAPHLVDDMMRTYARVCSLTVDVEPF